jgi:hypothetical protein
MRKLINNPWLQIGFILILLFIGSFLQGCSTYRPNTRKGWHIDEKNKHTAAIQRLDPIIYEQNKQFLPASMNQLEESLGWQERMKTRMRSMLGDK